MAKYQVSFNIYSRDHETDSATEQILTAQSDEDALQQVRAILIAREQVRSGRKVQVLALVRYVDLPADIPIYRMP